MDPRLIGCWKIVSQQIPTNDRTMIGGVTGHIVEFTEEG